LKTATRLTVLLLRRLAFDLIAEPRRVAFCEPVRFAARLTRSTLRINHLPALGQVTGNGALFGACEEFGKRVLRIFNRNRMRP
jgi:hypothetical protein